MSENKFCNGVSSSNSRETVCIETNRILDSCRDRDCYENVKVLLTDMGREIVARTSVVRTKHACVSSAHITIDPVQFNRGFYAVNVRLYIKLLLEACVGCNRPQEFEGIAVVEKRVILYGSENNVSIFRSSSSTNDFCACPDPVGCCKNAPSAVVEVVDPIVLCTKVVEKSNDCCCCCCCASDVPECVVYELDGTLADDNVEYDNERILVVSLGIFSIVRLVRPAQYMVNATEYCVPDKECVTGCDNDPCGIFRNMAFPASEFCSTPLNSNGIEKRCGC